MIRRKVLVTSRFPLSDLASWENRGLVTHPLAPLSTAEACRVLRAWGLVGDDTTLATLAERAGGHALSIAVLGSYGAFLGGDPSRATPSPDAGDDDPIARRLVEQSNEVEVALRCWALATRLGETGARQAGHALATTHGFGAFRATFARE